VGIGCLNRGRPRMTRSSATGGLTLRGSCPGEWLVAGRKSPPPISAMPSCSAADEPIASVPSCSTSLLLLFEPPGIPG